MNRDPLWNEIRKSLKERRFDPNVFERCAQDILRGLYPTLVPVVGGSDAGMDGAFSSIKGAFPLICTSEDDVIGNFRKSITNHLRVRGGPNRCVIATSIFLTPQRRQNILDAAKALDVVVEQIHDGEDFVGRLYSNEHWRLELLGVTGSPPALSVYPPRPRQAASSIIVGRDEDLQWLKSADSDALIVGQPGSGKTFLHQHWASTDNVVFAASDDPTLLANAIRSQVPGVIVIDDAHVRPQQVDLLRRLRFELSASFRIHANCWPNFDAVVAARMAIPTNQIRHLKPVPRKLMASIIESLGIIGPDVLLALLLDQARGKPGLCAALVEACKREGIQRVWTGEALAEQLLSGPSLLQDEVDREILARFALGGDGGANTTRVAAGVGLSLAQLRSRVAAIGAGGVITEFDNDALAVMPASLRAILVRDVFFRGMARPDITCALMDCVQPKEATHELIAAAQRGAKVSYDLLRGRVIEGNHRSLWEHYAYLSEQSAHDVLENHPEKVCDAGNGLLAHVPNLALQALMRADDAELIQNGSDTHHPHRLITEWLSPWDHEDETASRRGLLLDALELISKSLPSVSDDIVLKYLATVIDPGLSGLRSSPIDRLTVVHRRGIHSEETVRQIALLWPRVSNLLPSGKSRTWPTFFETVSDWAWPARHSNKLSDDFTNFMRETACGMLGDLLKASGCDTVRRHRIRWISDHAELGVIVPKDELFDVIFEDQDFGSWETEHARREELFQKLSDSLASKSAHEVGQLLGGIEAEVAGDSIHGGWDRGRLYDLMAQKVDNPLSWAETFIQEIIPAAFIRPFVDEIKKRSLADFRNIVRQLLPLEPYREMVIRFVLEESEDLAEFVDQVLRDLRPREKDNDYRFNYGRISIDIMKRLLDHPDSDIRVGAAMGEWERRPKLGVRPELFGPWKQVIVHANPRHDRSFDELFATFPDIGFEWARDRIVPGEYGLWEHAHTIMALAPKLSPAQRSEMLFRMTKPSCFDQAWFDALVGDDMELFRTWLAKQDDGEVRTLPLRRGPSPRWEELALVAMDSGVSPDELADEIGSWGETWGGSRSAHFQKYVDAYEVLIHHEDKRFHRIAQRGLAWAHACVDRAKLEEEAEAI